MSLNKTIFNSYNKYEKQNKKKCSYVFDFSLSYVDAYDFMISARLWIKVM